MTGLTLRVAEHIATARTEDIPPAAIHAAERSLLDAVGVMLAATTLGEGCGAFADLAAASPGPCMVLGRRDGATPLAAALANGALAHAIDYEDAHDGAPVHPNAAVVPVAMALAQQDPSITGADLIVACALGCDLVCRMGLSLTRNPDEFGWYPPPILSTFGATATAARLLRLDATRTAHAFALALAQSTFSSEFKTFPQSTLRAVRDGFPAHAGMLAAMLASRGVMGHLTAFEGKAGFFALFARGAWSPEVMTDGLGRKFHGEDVSYKPWPSCRGTHAPIEAALHLRPQVTSPVVAIEATGPALLTMLVEPAAQKQAPATAIDAKFSLPFCIGAALTHGGIAIRSFSDAGRGDTETLGLARLVRFSVDPALGMKDAAAGGLALRLEDGRTLQHFVKRARGSPENPLDDEALTAKFLDCATYAARPLAPSAAAKIANGLVSMSKAGSAATVFEALDA